jgi:hypothetical protein
MGYCMVIISLSFNRVENMVCYNIAMIKVLYSLISNLITKGLYSIYSTINSLQSDYRMISTTISLENKMITASYPLLSFNRVENMVCYWLYYYSVTYGILHGNHFTISMWRRRYEIITMQYPICYRIIIQSLKYHILYSTE